MDEKMKTEVVPVINSWRAGALSGQSIRGGCTAGDASSESRIQ
jgi:hypothetical protein